MAEYEIRISGVHYAANGDSVAGQKDTEEMHMRTRELLSRIDRVRPIVTLSPDPENHVHERALQARALGKRIGRVALECVDLVWDLLRASGMPMLLAKVKEVAVRNHGYAVVTVSAEALQQTQPTVASETEWGPWLSDLPLLPFPALPFGHRTGAREACRIVATSYSASTLFTISNIAVASSACASYLMNFPQKVKFSFFVWWFGGIVVSLHTVQPQKRRII